MKQSFFCLTATVIVFGVTEVNSGEDISKEGINTELLKRFDDSTGNPDPTLPLRLATPSTVFDLKYAFYHGSRVEQLMALDVAGYMSERWSVLPYLAALMGARDRSVASRASHSLLQLLLAESENIFGSVETVSAGVEQLAGQLLLLAEDVRFDVDIRTTALRGIQLIRNMGYELPDSLSIIDAKLLEDHEVLVRRAALATLTPPLEDDRLIWLAKIVSEDSDLWLKGQAAALLCENALAQGVTVPSKDLIQVMESVLGNSDVPGGAIGSILGCLSHFSVEIRGDLIDLAINHPDPSVKKFWNLLRRQ
jgi:hypothetical protein